MLVCLLSSVYNIQTALSVCMLCCLSCLYVVLLVTSLAALMRLGLLVCLCVFVCLYAFLSVTFLVGQVWQSTPLPVFVTDVACLYAVLLSAAFYFWLAPSQVAVSSYACTCQSHPARSPAPLMLMLLPCLHHLQTFNQELLLQLFKIREAR